jgi:hypothetical protein
VTVLFRVDFVGALQAALRIDPDWPVMRSRMAADRK